MKTYSYAIGLWIGIAGALSAQITLNRTPARAVGHPQLTVVTANPNLVEGREFFSPQNVALDTTVTPPVLYVSDFGNNRVLGWKNASDFSFGAKADFVVGQRDFFSTLRLGPGTAITSGLYRPTGVAVDRNGNLYVIDSGNNRILRFARPYAQSEPLPNLVIGQTSLSCSVCGQPNPGGVTSKTMYTSIFNGQSFSGALAFDAQDNLWFTDAGNHRVLRYPASALASGANTPSADIVLGQQTFDVNTQPPFNAQSATSRTLLLQPSGLAFDPAGRLYIADALNRVLVFGPNPFSGAQALRLMGILNPRPNTTPEINEVEFLGPQSIFIYMQGSSARVGIVDTGHHRIMLFDRFEDWPSDTTQPPHANGLPLGQAFYGVAKANRELPEPSGATLSGPTSAIATATELFVVDSGNNRVLVFQTSSLGQNTTATRVLGQDQFHLRSTNLTEGREFQFVAGGGGGDGGMVLDLAAQVPHLYVADTYNHRVLGFRDARKLRPGDKADLIIGQPDHQRTLINYPGNDPDRPNAQGLFFPVGVTLDSAGNLYVADSGNGRVVRFPSPFQSGASNPSADLVLGQSSLTSPRLPDPTARTMRSPYGLSFAGDGGLLVSDSGLNRVLFFAGKANTFTSGMAASNVFGQSDFNGSNSGSDTNRLNNPKHVDTDTDGRLYVADEGNNRVLIFDDAPHASNNPRAAVILTGQNQNSNFNAPRGIFVSKITGEIWTTEVNVGRLLRFPKFNDLTQQQNASNFQIPTNQALAITQDSFGDVFAAELTNRIAIYFPDFRKALNAANYIPARALAPGTIVYLEANEGVRFATSEAVNSAAIWPKVLNDVQVLVRDVPAPIYYVFPDKIAFQMPYSAPTSGNVEVQAVKQSTGQILAVSQVEMAPASPALFTNNSSGFGQIAAYNEDGTLNTPTSPIPRGKVIQMYGTGQGPVPNAPADGEPASGAIRTDALPRVIINNVFVPDADIQYSGLAPGLVGVWQLNIKIADTVPPLPNISVFVQMRSISSPLPGVQTTIAVRQ